MTTTVSPVTATPEVRTLPDLDAEDIARAVIGRPLANATGQPVQHHGDVYRITKAEPIRDGIRVVIEDRDTGTAVYATLLLAAHGVVSA
ncbi:hypothetical protein [Serinicoccus sediminis]|uniref:hypothetical protein n=1 Tax=Serinicoccus sediminis TaxID=2306021 RepID=UPI00102217CB|nr:hypothetical protein [Serinicoccus sediminis]